MGDFRIRYGLAIGRENNFYTGIAGQKGYLAGTDGLFAQGNTAPDVTVGNLFYSNNTVNTTITTFGLSHPSQGAGNLAGLFEGKLITVVFLDDSTRLARSAGLFTVGTDGWQAAGTITSFVYHGSAWYQFGGERTQNNFINVTSANVVYGAQSSLYVRGINTISVSNGAAANFTIFTATGGEQGQEITFFANGSAFQITANTAGLPNSFVTTSSTGSLFVVPASGTISFRFIGNQWVESR